MDNAEIEGLRKKLAHLLDLATPLKLKGEDIRAILKDQFPSDYENVSLSDGLRLVHQRAERVSVGAGDRMFDAEIGSWEARNEPIENGIADAQEETKFVFPFAVIRQEAVGHGGFHTGALGFRRPLLRWVYDCGSWRRRASLERRIHSFLERSRQVAGQHDVDVLFISHFDADHVNGLERLFAGRDGLATSVRIVVAPYLGPLESLAVVGRELRAGKDDPNFIRAVTDPGAYFQDKGVETLILIRPDEPPPDSSEGSISPVRPLPPAPPPSKDAPMGLEFFRDDGKRFTIDPTEPDDGINVIVADPGSFFEVSSHGRWLNWVFVPHAHLWSFNRERVAEQARHFLDVDPADPHFREELIATLRTRVGVRQIKKIYLGMNSNATSMSLYAGPRPPGKERKVFTTPTQPAGWLLTGDAPLNKRDAFNAWRHSFAPLALSVGRLMLPHHGAERNFNADLTRFVPKATMFLTVDRDDFVHKKRPPVTVRKKLGDKFVAVTERTEILEVSGEPRGEHMLLAVSQW